MVEHSFQTFTGKRFLLRDNEEIYITPYSRFLFAHLPEVKPGALVMDYGVGTGLHAIALSCEGAGRVIGVDINEQALALCRRNSEINQVTNLELYLGCHELDGVISAGSIDLVVSNPASLPSGKVLSPFFDAGTYGNSMIFELIDVAETYLKPGGTLTFIHTSLVPLADTLSRLQERGFVTGVVALQHLEFRDFYFDLLPHFKMIYDQGKNFFIQKQNRHFEILYLLEARKRNN